MSIVKISGLQNNPIPTVNVPNFGNSGIKSTIANPLPLRQVNDFPPIFNDSINYSLIRCPLPCKFAYNTVHVLTKNTTKNSYFPPKGYKTYRATPLPPANNYDQYKSKLN